MTVTTGWAKVVATKQAHMIHHERVRTNSSLTSLPGFRKFQTFHAKEEPTKMHRMMKITHCTSAFTLHASISLFMGLRYGGRDGPCSTAAQ